MRYVLMTYSGGNTRSASPVRRSGEIVAHNSFKEAEDDADRYRRNLPKGSTVRYYIEREAN